MLFCYKIMKFIVILNNVCETDNNNEAGEEITFS